MKDLQFGLTGVYGRRPIDVSLPVVGEEALYRRPAFGKCFHVSSPANAVVSLFSKNADGVRRSATVDIRSACRENSDIAIYIVRAENGGLYLRAYLDESVNGIFPLPSQLYQ